MRAILICPDERPALARLAGVAPLANLPILGQGLAEYWLEHLAVLGAKEVLVLAADRPHEVRARVERGARWGLRVEVIPETRELTVAEAREKYRQGQTGGWLPEPNDAVLLDRLPGLPEQPLLTGYSDFFAAVSAWFSRTASPLRVGMHELQPGIRAGLRTHVAPSARLHPPCWLGDQVWIGPDAEIGPMAVLEDRVFVEGGSTISHSLVGPETFVGRLTDLRDSIAWGRRL